MLKFSTFSRYRPITWAILRRTQQQYDKIRLYSNSAETSTRPQPIFSQKLKSQSTKVCEKLRHLKINATFCLILIFIIIKQVRPIVDSRVIKVEGGKGGDGCVSLARICNNPMAGPGISYVIIISPNIAYMIVSFLKMEVMVEMEAMSPSR